MAFRNVPEKKYRLHDGSLGTAWDALNETLKVLQTRLRSIEEDIEVTKLQMLTADGRPLDE